MFLYQQVNKIFLNFILVILLSINKTDDTAHIKEEVPLNCIQYVLVAGFRHGMVFCKLFSFISKQH